MNRAWGLCLALAGCASAPAQDINVVQRVGDRFVGKAAGTMFARYGAPPRQMETGGVTVYTWERSDTLYFRTQPPLVVRCQLDAYVSDGVVRTVGVNGKQAACVQFLP